MIPRFIVRPVSLWIAFVLLALAIVLRLLFMDNVRSQERFFLDVEQNIHHALSEIEDNAQLLRQQIRYRDTLSFSLLNADTQYPYFLYQQDSLLYWSDYRFVPPLDSLKGDYEYQLKQFASGSYIVRQDSLQDMLLYFLLPVYQENKINNQYISSGFNLALFPQEVATVQLPDSTDKNPLTIERTVQYQGQPLLTLSLQHLPRGYREHATARLFQSLISGLLALAILLVLLHVYWKADALGRRSQAWRGFLLLTFSLLSARMLMLLFGFPASILPNMLFDGRYYALSSLNPSLGDLLLNALSVLVVVVYIFRYYATFGLFQWLYHSSRKVKSVFSVVLLLLTIGALFTHYYFIRTLYFNSQWTLDITESIDFSFLKIISLLVFVINTSSFFLLAHVLIRVVLSLSTKSYLNLKSHLLIALSIAGLASLLTVSFPVSVVVISGCYFLLLFGLNLPRVLGRLNYISFLYVFAGALASAVAGAMAAYHMKQVNSLDSKQKFANQLLVDNDVFGEYLLHEAVERIERDPFIKTRLFTLGSKDIIKQKIKRIYLSDYFDKYDVQVHLFNLQGKPLDQVPATSYHKLRESVSARRFETEYNNIFFIDESSRHINSEEPSKRYLTFIDLENYGKTIGYVVLDLSLKRFIPNRVYPELLVDYEYLPFYPDNEYAYAIFSSQGKMIYSTGDEEAFKGLEGYHFQQKVENEKELNINQYNYLIVDGEADEYIVIASESYSWSDAVSNFSFLFLVLVFVILILVGLYAIYFAFRAENLNFATKIQLYMNAAFFMPLLAVSLTTLSVISQSYTEEVEREYLKKAEQISDNLIDLLDSYQKQQISEETLVNTLSQVAQYAETDANLFNTEGKLIASSQPSIYTQELLSEHINPVAYANIRERDNNKLVLDESVGKLAYKSSYMGLKSFKSGQLIGVVSLPFFEASSDLQRQIIQVLTNIMDIFTFVFIVFLIVSYLASMLLTYPLQYIRHKIRKTSLSDYNAPLSWESNDEIGLVIGEYNRMLVNLEASKAALARNEKESAWREMAKQVAHEIKNPLTPMRLSLQLLKRKLENDYAYGMAAAEVKEISRPIDNMLHQVDTLNDIASSFSNFAQMPMPKSEPYELSSIVRKTVGLFDGEQQISLEIEERSSYIVLGDKQLMGRILSNLIINAKQSIPKDRDPKITVSLQKSGIDKIILKVSDNGTGIAREIQHKVFLPNFSTKYAGSGIGLAIARRGIEHAGGRIAFDTREGAGTTFFIELPLILDQMLVVQEKN